MELVITKQKMPVTCHICLKNQKKIQMFLLFWSYGAYVLLMAVLAVSTLNKSLSRFFLLRLIFLQLFRNFINKFVPKCFGSLLLMMAAFSTLVI